MEETLQQENQESDYKNLIEDQGGIRRRLRDRDLLKKRKAEAEQKETNQWVFGVESQRKRTRAESGTKRRGRPKKSEPRPEICVNQEEAAVPREAPPGAAAVPEPAEVVPYQTADSSSPVPDVESQQPSAPDAPALRPLLGSTQSPKVFAPTLTAPAPVIPTPALFSPSAPVSYPVKLADFAPVPVPYSPPDAVPDAVPVPTQALVPTAAPPQVQSSLPESQGRKDQVPIKDLGPGDEEEEDVYSSSDQTANEDLIGTSSINVPEQNKMFSIPTLSSTPPPHKYFPGNLF